MNFTSSEFISSRFVLFSLFCLLIILIHLPCPPCSSIQWATDWCVACSCPFCLQSSPMHCSKQNLRFVCFVFFLSLLLLPSSPIFALVLRLVRDLFFHVIRRTRVPLRSRLADLPFLSSPLSLPSLLVLILIAKRKKKERPLSSY